MTAVLFVCARNGGKSQMAAGLMRATAPDWAVDSAGTDPGTTLNSQSVASLAEVGIDISAGTPKPVTTDLLAAADVVVTLGTEAHLDHDLVAAAPGTAFETWVTDEPSARGIEGMARMRLIRDDITRRAADLRRRLEERTSPAN